MPVDTKNQSAEWWAEQAQRYKAETATLQRKYDELAQSSAVALKEGLRNALKTQQERLAKEHEKVVQQLLQEPAEVRQLREAHAREAREMALKHGKERSELVSQMK